MTTLERANLFIVDDWGPEQLNVEQRRDLLEIVDDRYDRASLLITSQVPVTSWHSIIGDPTLGDAILGRVLHTAHRIELTHLGRHLHQRPTTALQQRDRLPFELGKKSPPRLRHSTPPGPHGLSKGVHQIEGPSPRRSMPWWMPRAAPCASNSRRDRSMAAVLLADIEPGATLLADRAYDSNAILADAKARSVWANIPPKRNRKASFSFSRWVYWQRNLIKRFFNRIKQYRSIATRYDKCPLNFLAAPRHPSVFRLAVDVGNLGVIQGLRCNFGGSWF